MTVHIFWKLTRPIEDNAKYASIMSLGNHTGGHLQLEVLKVQKQVV